MIVFREAVDPKERKHEEHNPLLHCQLALCSTQLAPERPLARAVGHPHNVEQIGMPKYGTAWQSTKL